MLTMNLCRILPADQLADVLEAVDVTCSGFEISKKQLDLIPSAGGTPEAVKAYIAAKAVASLSRKTLGQYTYKLTNFFAAVRKSYADITANDIRVYLYQYKTDRNASNRYLDNIRITLNGFFSWLVDNDYIRKNPCANVDAIKYQVKRREPLTPYQLEITRWNCTDIRARALIDFLFSTGCRVSECADVRLSDIDWDNRAVHIRHGKGDKERITYFNAESELTLRKYLETRADDTDALFVSMKAPHGPLQARAMEVIVSKAGARADLHVFPHKLRHTFATAGLRGGLPLEQLQVLLGHTKPETTLIYAKQDQMDIQQGHRRVYA